MQKKQEKQKQLKDQNTQILTKKQKQQLQNQFADVLTYKNQTSKKVSVVDTAKKILPQSYNQIRKLGQLFSYIDTQKIISKNTQVQKLMIGYSTLFLGAFIASLIVPKKILSKAIIGLGIYGVKAQVTDYYVVVQSLKMIALSNNMQKEEQQVRNILEYFYEKKKKDLIFKNKTLGIQQKQQDIEQDPLLQKIRQQTRKYYLYLDNKDLL